MFETNTASCGGFAGISNSFAAALWALDYDFQLAYGNFIQALLHVGGQNVFFTMYASSFLFIIAFKIHSQNLMFYLSLSHSQLRLDQVLL